MAYIRDSDILKLEELHATMQEMPKIHHHIDSSFHFLIYDAANLPRICDVARTLRGSVESVLNIYRR